MTVELRSSDPKSEAGSNERKSSLGTCKGTGAAVQRLRLGKWVGVCVSYNVKPVARDENRGLTVHSRLQPQARCSCPRTGSVGVRIFLDFLLASPPFPPCSRHRGTYDTVLRSGAHSSAGESPMSDKSSYLDGYGTQPSSGKQGPLSSFHSRELLTSWEPSVPYGRRRPQIKWSLGPFCCSSVALV